MNRSTASPSMYPPKPQTMSPEDTITQILDLQVPTSVQLSPSGKQVIYTTTLFRNHRTGDHNVSTLWLAETGKPDSARQITSGLTNDTSPQWHPTDNAIAFISDRAAPGKSSGSVIYLLSLQGGEAFPLTDVGNERSIAQFVWSPCGKFIAYLSADEKTAGQKAREESGEDVVVWGEEWEFNRLRLLHVATKTVEVLVSRDAHVAELAWKRDAKAIAFTVQRTPELDSPWEGGSLEYVRLEEGKKKAVVVCEAVCSMSSLCWVGDEIFFVGNAEVDVLASSVVLYSVPVEGGDWVRKAGGEVDCAQMVLGVEDAVLVQILSGLGSAIRDLDGKALIEESTTEFDSWHAVSPSPGHFVLVAAKSSTSFPTEVFSWEQASPDEEPQQLSSHGKGIKPNAKPPTVLSVKSSDGKVELDGLFIAPDNGSSGPYPTVVMPHGGPYYRTTGTYMSAVGWEPYLLSAGYAVMSPNYRGGSGHGSDFAAFARGGVGTVEYDDVITLTQHCIDQKLIDKEKVIVGGWSQGGFLSYLSSVRNGAHGLGWRFSGAICGAGVTDWDTMATTSDVGAWQSELGGIAPWSAEKSDTQNRKGSALWEMADAAKAGRIPPILILHGEKDERVPLTQAVGFYRGCKKWELACEMVVYPRENHGFAERKHRADVLQRVRKFCDLHIS